MRWHSHLRGLIHNVGRRVEHNLGGNENYRNIVTHSLHSTGDSVALKLPYLNGPRPLYQFLQQLRICTSRRLLADSSNDATPISSPLTPVLAPGSGKAEGQAVVAKPGKFQAVLKGIKQSRKKINLVAALVRGMRVEDALLQMQVTVKRAAKTVFQLKLLLVKGFTKRGFHIMPNIGRG